MCAISCAITPSSSCLFSLSSSPRVTAMAEFSGLLPVANAFGAESSMMYAFGVGIPAASANPSTVWYRYGSSFFVTGFAFAKVISMFLPA